MLLTAAFVGGSGEAVADDDDPFGVRDKFGDYRTATLDPASVRADLEDGLIVLLLGDEPYPLKMEPVEGRGAFDVHRLTEDGNVVHEETRLGLSYRGHLVDAPERLATIQITQTGVDGAIQGGEGPAVYFESARYHDASAPVGATIVYHPGDVRLMEGFGTPDDPALTFPDDPSSLPQSDPTTQSHESGPDRKMNLWSDPEMLNAYGSGWSDRAWSVFEDTSMLFFFDVHFRFQVGAIYYCDTTACAEAWGMTSTDRRYLLSEWAAKVPQCGGCVDYELSHLLTGKDLDGGYIGRGYLPGNAAISQMVDAGGTYQGGTSRYEASLLIMHEVGHNFNGRHERSSESYHRHCVITVVLCVLPSSWTHYTTMAATFAHHPESNREMLGEFSDDTSDGNWHWIRSCNHSSWSKGSYGSFCRG